MDRDEVSKAEVHLSGLGWIRIEWDTPVSKEHADLALAEAVSPSRLQPSGDGGKPFAYFQYNEGWGTWEQVADNFASTEGVIPAYRSSPSPAKAEPSYADGYAKALEDAAKVANDYARVIDITENPEAAPACIAASIRALAGKDALGRDGEG